MLQCRGSCFADVHRVLWRKWWRILHHTVCLKVLECRLVSWSLDNLWTWLYSGLKTVIFFMIAMVLDTCSPSQIFSHAESDPANFVLPYCWPMSSNIQRLPSAYLQSVFKTTGTNKTHVSHQIVLYPQWQIRLRRGCCIPQKTLPCDFNFRMQGQIFHIQAKQPCIFPMQGSLGHKYGCFARAALN